MIEKVIKWVLNNKVKAIFLFIAFFIVLLHNSKFLDRQYSKNNLLIKKIQQEGVKENFKVRLQNIYEESIITDISLIRKGFRNSTNYTYKKKEGTSTYLVVIDSIEREFYVTWKKDFSDQEIVITIIEEVNDGKKSMIYKYTE